MSLTNRVVSERDARTRVSAAPRSFIINGRPETLTHCLIVRCFPPSFSFVFLLSRLKRLAVNLLFFFFFLLRAKCHFSAQRPGDVPAAKGARYESSGVSSPISSRNCNRDCCVKVLLLSKLPLSVFEHELYHFSTPIIFLHGCISPPRDIYFRFAVCDSKRPCL